MELESIESLYVWMYVLVVYAESVLALCLKGLWVIRRVIKTSYDNVKTRHKGKGRRREQRNVWGEGKTDDQASTEERKKSEVEEGEGKCGVNMYSKLAR